jgi:hypothetical protein
MIIDDARAIVGLVDRGTQRNSHGSSTAAGRLAAGRGLLPSRLERKKARAMIAFAPIGRVFQ